MSLHSVQSIIRGKNWDLWARFSVCMHCKPPLQTRIFPSCWKENNLEMKQTKKNNETSGALNYLFGKHLTCILIAQLGLLEKKSVIR